MFFRMEIRSGMGLGTKRILCIGAASALLLPATGMDALVEESHPDGESPWVTTPASGFRKGASHCTLSAGAALGEASFLRRGDAHDWVLGTIEYGFMVGEVQGAGHWYAGNWELIGQAFGGIQYAPSSAYITGVAPLLRYNLAVGHRLVPFIDVGAGVSATDIRDGHLSTTFEFNSQAGAGVHILMKDDLALTLQYRIYHVSNGGMDQPNAGVDTSAILAGITVLF